LRRTGPTNIHLRLTISYLRRKSRENGARIWRRVAELLSAPTRQRVEVNVSRINRYTSPGDVVVVPGKVLGAGAMDHPVVVGAWKFSKSAKEKIERAGGKAVSIIELVDHYPDGSNVKIIA